MVPYVLWLILAVSFLSSVSSVVGAVAQTAEAARAHAEDLTGEVVEPLEPRDSTRKEKLEFTSLILNMLIAALGMLVAGINLMLPPDGYDAAPFLVVPLVWAAGLLSSGGIVVFSSSYLGRYPNAWKRQLAGVR